MSLALSADSITDNQGVRILKYQDLSIFVPTGSGNLILFSGWELNSSLSDSSGNGNNANGSLPVYQSSGRFGESVSFNGVDFGKSVLSNGVTFESSSVSLSMWVYPESDDFYLFNVDGVPLPVSISLLKQRPVLTMGTRSNLLPGTEINEFWANGYLPLNQWSHLVLTYDLSSKEVEFFINGELDALSSFAGNLSFPLSNGFRLGPTDDYQATSTVGEIDDFRIYATSLTADEVKKLYGGGKGDF